LGHLPTVHIILLLLCGEQKRQNPIKMRYWEMLADKLSKAGWSLGWAQPSIPKDERCGLLMRTAMMAKGSSFGQMKCSQHSLSSKESPTN